MTPDEDPGGINRWLIAPAICKMLCAVSALIQLWALYLVWNEENIRFRVLAVILTIAFSLFYWYFDIQVRRERGKRSQRR